MRELVRLQVDLAANKHDELVVFFHELPWIEKNLPTAQAVDLRRRINKYERFTKQLLRSGIRTGEFRALSPETVLYSIIGILAYVPNWFRPSTQRAQATLTDEITTFVLSGITSDDNRPGPIGEAVDQAGATA